MAPKKENTEQSMTLEQMQAEIKRMLEEAKAEAEKIVADAKATVAVDEERLTEEQEARKAYMNEYVDVKLFKDTGKYKDDVFVSVNGETCLIKRGERVKIKRKFAEVLDASDFQDYQTAKLIEKESSEDKFAGNV